MPTSHVIDSLQDGRIVHDDGTFTYLVEPSAWTCVEGARWYVNAVMYVESNELSLLRCLDLFKLHLWCTGDRLYKRTWGATSVGVSDLYGTFAPPLYMT